MAWTEQEVDDLLARVARMNDKAKQIAENKKLPKSTQYYRANREHLLAKAREWRKNNPDKVAAALARYKERHPDAHAIAVAKWAANNREKRRKYQNNYRTKNRDKVAAYGRDYYARHSAELLARRRERYANDPDYRAKLLESRRQRRAKLKKDAEDKAFLDAIHREKAERERKKDNYKSECCRLAVVARARNREKKGERVQE